MKGLLPIFFIICSHSFGQQTFAVYDPEGRLEEIYRYHIAMSTIEQFVKAKTDTLEMMQKEIETITHDGCFGRSWSEETIQQKMEEYQRLYNKFQAFQYEAELEVIEMQDQLITPVLAWINEQLLEYKESKGIDILLSSENVLYFGYDCDDITEDFIDFLNNQ